MSGFHDAGAVALVKHRGRQRNTGSKFAIALLNAVHGQVVSLWSPLATECSLSQLMCVRLSTCLKSWFQ